MGPATRTAIESFEGQIGRSRTGRATTSLLTALKATESLPRPDVGSVFSHALRSGGRAPEVVVLPTGSFRMGSDNDYDDEKPVRRVTINYPLAMMTHEVTWDDWEACVRGGGCDSSGPASAGGDEGWGKGSRPVINVNWNDAQAYARWLSAQTGSSYRLPTEAEWEYAARAGTTTNYFWGNEVGSNRANCDGCGSPWDNSQTAPVGRFAANPWGLYDMHGNAREWVQDCYRDTYSGAPSDGSARTNNCATSGSHVIRGGSWFTSSGNVDSAYRGIQPPEKRDNEFGFRLVLELNASSPAQARSASQQTGSSRSSALPATGNRFSDAMNSGGRGPELVALPTGSFQMGSNDGDSDEQPVHRVTINYPLAMMIHEVTWNEWEACVRGGGCDSRGPASEGGDEGWGKGSRPVINVSWNDAQAYARWMSRQTGNTYRLPSEAEWEYAARAGASTKYSWGNDIGQNRANCDGCGSRWDNEQTAPVGSFAANRWGLHDMHGNAREWVEDCKHSNYQGAPSDGSARTRCDDTDRIVRGGSWYSLPGSVRVTYRLWNEPDTRNHFVGFRLVRELNASSPAQARSASQQTTTSRVATGPAAGETFSNALSSGGRGPELVVLPTGSFMMGSNNGDQDEKPVHRVTINNRLAMMTHEVTWEQWQTCVRAGGCNGSGPEDAGGDSDWGKRSRPVIHVSWNDAKAYARWLSNQTGKRYRLPSEAEWEYAARAGTSTDYVWGNDIGQNRANCDGCGSPWDDSQTAPVGRFTANPWGLHDMHGNVQEWVEDCRHNSYSGAPSNGSAWTTGCVERYKVIRGGSWYSLGPQLKSAHRRWAEPGVRNNNIGFRLVQELSP